METSRRAALLTFSVGTPPILTDQATSPSSIEAGQEAFSKLQRPPTARRWLGKKGGCWTRTACSWFTWLRTPMGGPERQVKIRVVGRQRIVAYQHPDNAESPEPRNKKQSKDAQRHGSVCHHNSECAWSMLLKPTTSEPSPLLIGYDWWWLLGGMPG
jgi:hypothetical protein